MGELRRASRRKWHLDLDLEDELLYLISHVRCWQSKFGLSCDLMGKKKCRPVSDCLFIINTPLVPIPAWDPSVPGCDGILSLWVGWKACCQCCLKGIPNRLYSVLNHGTCSSFSEITTWIKHIYLADDCKNSHFLLMVENCLDSWLTPHLSRPTFVTGRGQWIILLLIKTCSWQENGRMCRRNVPIVTITRVMSKFSTGSWATKLPRRYTCLQCECFFFLQLNGS